MDLLERARVLGGAGRRAGRRGRRRPGRAGGRRGRDRQVGPGQAVHRAAGGRRPVPSRGLRPPAHPAGPGAAARHRPPDRRPAGRAAGRRPARAPLRRPPGRARPGRPAAGGGGRGRPLGRRGDPGPAGVPGPAAGADPGLLLVTYRDDELAATHPLRAAVGRLAPEAVRRLQLEPLSEAAVAELARRAGRPAAGLHALTGGNPLLVTKVLAAGDAGVP